MRFTQLWNKTGSDFEASRLVQFSEVLSCWSAGSVSGVEDQILVDVGELR